MKLVQYSFLFGIRRRADFLISLMGVFVLITSFPQPAAGQPVQSTLELEKIFNDPDAYQERLRFGIGATIRDDRAVFSANTPDERSVVYIYKRDGTNWNLEQSILSESGRIDFGRKAELAGDTLVLGDFGAIHFYLRSNATWTFQQTISTNLGGFGESLAISGDTVIAGASGDADGGFNAGSALVYTRTNGVWGLQQKLQFSPRAASDLFGGSVAIDGDCAVVGMQGEDDGGNSAGAAVVFNRTNGVWTLSQKLVASDRKAFDSLGTAVAVQGNTIMVSAPNSGSKGAIYRFEREGATWLEKQRLMPPEMGNGGFGEDIALDGDGLVVADLWSGIVHHFSKFGDTWYYAGQIKPQSDIPGYQNAYRVGDVGIDGDTVIAGFGDPDEMVGPVFVFHVTRDYSAAAEYARQLLYYPDAQAGTEFDPEQAAFRYKHLLYGQTNGQIRARFELMNDFYGQAERDRAGEAESLLKLALQYSTTNADLGSALLDIYYDRTAAEIILAKDLLSKAERAHYGGVLLAVPPPPRFLIDAEIPLYRGVTASYQSALDGYLALLSDDFGLTNQPPLGFQVFKTLVPARGLMTSTYTNGSGVSIPVNTNAMLFSGYKDLTLLFDGLRDYGQSASTLTSLLLSRNNPGDREEAQGLITGTLRRLYLQGNMLRGMFPDLPDFDDASGIGAAIEGWEQSLTALETWRQQIAGNTDPLGFSPDFLMLVQKLPGQSGDLFDSFDALKGRLNPNPAADANPLQNAKLRLDTARSGYQDYRGFEDQLFTQFSQMTTATRQRLLEIVGAMPGDPNYDSTNAIEGSEIWQQLQSIDVAKLRIERNRIEMANVNQKVHIEMERRGKEKGVNNAIHQVGIKYRDLVAPLDEKINTINSVQDVVSGIGQALTLRNLTQSLSKKGSKGPSNTRFFGGLAVGMLVQVGGDLLKGDLEKQKADLAAQEQAEVLALNNQLIDINSDAKIKTWLLEMNTLAVDSQEAALLLQQEVGRLVALYREKEALEAQLEQADTDLSRRYFADPIHRLLADANMVNADLAFRQAQKWCFFMLRALEYKWNRPFNLIASESGDGQPWNASDLLKCRNAEELVAFYDALIDFDLLYQAPGVSDDRFDWFSVREDFLGYKRLDAQGHPILYVDPETGESVDAIEAFRRHLQRAQDALGQIRLDFSTVRQIPGGSFFRGPRFLANGQVDPLQKGLYLDKIRWIKIRLPGGHTTPRSTVNASLTYGGISYLRNPTVGTLDPQRPDRLYGEMTPYSTRYWYFGSQPTAGWRFQEALSATVSLLKADRNNPRLDGGPGQIDVLPSVQQIDTFKERSVAATGWRLIIPTVDLGTTVLRIDELDDIELYFYHYAFERVE